MVRPNCWRTLAYSTAASTQSAAPPTASAASNVRARASADSRAPRQDVVGGHGHVLQPDPSGAPGRIEVLGHLHRHAGAIALQHQHVVTGGDQQQLGQPGAQAPPRPHRRPRPSLICTPPSRPIAGRDRSVDQPRQQPRLLVGGALLGDHRRRDHGRHERARRHRAAEFFDHHHELGQPVAGAAVLLVDVQAEPAELDHALPEGRPRLLGRVQQRSRRRSAPSARSGTRARRQRVRGGRRSVRYPSGPSSRGLAPRIIRRVAEKECT